MTDSVFDPCDVEGAIKRAQLNELERLLRYHNARYWDDAAAEISDPEYDRLVAALRRVASDSPVLQALGPARFGAEVVHPEPMLSLDKAYEKKQLAAFVQTEKTQVRKVFGDLVVTPKIDGVACSLRYNEQGLLQVAATRGDGKRGEDITANARRVASIPTQLPGLTTAVEVRGELYMPKARFAERYAQDFVNPRNLCAGAIKQKDPDKSAAYGLQFFAYELLGAELETEKEKLERLRDLGFTCPPSETVASGSIDDIWRSIEHTQVVSGSLDVETDGVVLKVDTLSEQRALGLTAHHPNYAIAFKFQAERGESTLIGIDWSVARSGRITPVAVVEPVFLSGASVSRASLHNLEILEKIGLSCGCRVEMSRRGEVIPQVEAVLEPGDAPCVAPTQCPSCGGPVQRREQFLYCLSAETCPDVLVGTLKHFCKVLDIEGFGDKLLSGLVRGGLVHKPADFFALRREDLLALRQTKSTDQGDLEKIVGAVDSQNEGDFLRIGEVLADKLLASIQGRRTLSLDRFLAALGIDDLGPVMAAKLVDHLHDLPAIRAAEAQDLVNIEGFGEERAQSIVEGLKNLGPRIDALLEQVLLTVPERVQSEHVISGKSVVFTGKMALMDRKRAQQRVRELGGQTPSSVTQDLDFLVVGDLGSPLLGEGKMSGKQQTAERFIAKGATIRVVGEAVFWTLMEADSAASEPSESRKSV